MKIKLLLTAVLVGTAAWSARAGVSFGFSVGAPAVVVAAPVPVLVAAPVVAAPVYADSGYIWAPGYWSVNTCGRVWVPGCWRYGPGYCGGYWRGGYGYGYGYHGGYGYGHGGHR